MLNEGLWLVAANVALDKWSEWTYTKQSQKALPWQRQVLTRGSLLLSLSFFVSSLVAQDRKLHVLFTTAAAVSYWSRVESVTTRQRAAAAVSASTEALPSPLASANVSPNSALNSGKLTPPLVTVHPPRKRQGVVILFCASVAFLASLRLGRDAHVFWGAFFCSFAVSYRALAGAWLIGIPPVTMAGHRRFQVLQAIGYTCLAFAPLALAPSQLNLCAEDDGNLTCVERVRTLGRWTQGAAACAMIMSLEVFQRRAKPEMKKVRPGVTQWVQAVVVTVLPVVLALQLLMGGETSLMDMMRMEKANEVEIAQQMVSAAVLCVLPFALLNAAVLLGPGRALSTVFVIGASRPLGLACCLMGWMSYAMAALLLSRTLRPSADITRAVMLFAASSWLCFSSAILLAFGQPKRISVAISTDARRRAEAYHLPLMDVLCTVVLGCAVGVEAKGLTEISYEGATRRNARREVMAPLLAGLILAILLLNALSTRKKSRFGSLYTTLAPLLVSSAALLAGANLTCSIPQRYLAPTGARPLCDSLQNSYSLTAAATLALVCHVLSRIVNSFPLTERQELVLAAQGPESSAPKEKDEKPTLRLDAKQSQKEEDSSEEDEEEEPGEEPLPSLSADEEADSEVEVEGLDAGRVMHEDVEGENQVDDGEGTNGAPQSLAPVPRAFLPPRVMGASRSSSSSGLEQPLNESPLPETFHTSPDDADDHISQVSEASHLSSGASGPENSQRATVEAHLSDDPISRGVSTQQISRTDTTLSIAVVRELLIDLLDSIADTSPVTTPTTVDTLPENGDIEVEDTGMSAPVVPADLSDHKTTSAEELVKEEVAQLSPAVEDYDADQSSTPLVERHVAPRARAGRNGNFGAVSAVSLATAKEVEDIRSQSSKNSTCSCSYCVERGTDTDEGAFASSDAEDSLRPLSISHTDDNEFVRGSAVKESVKRRQRGFSDESLASLISSNASESSYSSSDTQGQTREYPLKSGQAKRKPLPPALPPRRYQSMK